jgi:hypothetical protein
MNLKIKIINVKNIIFVTISPACEKKAELGVRQSPNAAQDCAHQERQILTKLLGT